jgi:hypothetical protein
MKIKGAGEIAKLLEPLSKTAFYKIEEPGGSIIQLGDSGLKLLKSYYARKYGAVIALPEHKESGRPVSIEEFPAKAHELFERARAGNGDARCAFLVGDGEQCVPVIFMRENGVESILVADSRGEHKDDLAQKLAAKFEKIDVYRVDAPRRRDKSKIDKASSYVDGMKFAATIAGRRRSSEGAVSYILPNMAQELRERSKLPGPDRVMAVTLPAELAKLSQLDDLIKAEPEGDTKEVPMRGDAKKRTLTEFRDAHRVSIQAPVDDSNGESVSESRIDYVRLKSFKYPDLIHIEHFNQELVKHCEKAGGEKWTPKRQSRFVEQLKNVRCEGTL